MFLTLAEYKVISTLGADESTYPLEIWLETIDGVLCAYTWDRSKKGFNSAIKVIATAMVDYFVSVKNRNAIMAANSSIKSARLGSFGYTMAEGSLLRMDGGKILDSLTPDIAFLMSIFLKDSISVITTRVFPELPEYEGVRDYADIIKENYPLAYDRGILGSDL